MHAVVEIAGKQYTVAPKDTIIVPTLKEKIGATITFDRVLLFAGEKETTVGHPLVAGATVQATVLEAGKGAKVIVFKKKKRKNYRVTKGHRQGFTKLEITNIAK